MIQPTTAKTLKPSEIYGQAGLIYIRYHAEIEDKATGQKKIGGKRPAFSKIAKQIKYEAGAGRYYSLLMGREFKPGRFAVCSISTTRRMVIPRTVWNWQQS